MFPLPHEREIRAALFMSNVAIIVRGSGVMLSVSNPFLGRRKSVLDYITLELPVTVGRRHCVDLHRFYIVTYKM